MPLRDLRAPDWRSAEEGSGSGGGSPIVQRDRRLQEEGLQIGRPDQSPVLCTQRPLELAAPVARDGGQAVARTRARGCAAKQLLFGAGAAQRLQSPWRVGGPPGGATSLCTIPQLTRRKAPETTPIPRPVIFFTCLIFKGKHLDQAPPGLPELPVPLPTPNKLRQLFPLVFPVRPLPQWQGWGSALCLLQQL